MVIVFLLSHQPRDVSATTSGNLIVTVLELLGLKEDFLTFELHNFVRKMAHFISYMFGGMLLCAFFYVSGLFKRTKVLISLAIGVVYAVFDEIHQKYVPGRGSEFRDVLIDSAGVAIGVFLVAITITVIKCIYKFVCKRKEAQRNEF